MVKLYNGGAWLVNGTEIVEDNKDASAVIANLTGKAPVSKEEASKETIAYSILEKHNTSGNMDDLQIKFDKLTSHDITFVGIIQTARASGLEKFPIPYVLTILFVRSVEQSMKMTTCLDLPAQNVMVECMYRRIRQSFISLQEKCLQAVEK